MQKRKSCLKGGENGSTVLAVEEDAKEVQGDGSEETDNKHISKPKQEVAFGDLVIYEFPNLLGDNPGVSEGAPLTIGWKHETKNVVAVDYYEFLRQSRPRRRRKDLIMPSAERDTFLLGMGYKLAQIVTAAEETKKIRKSRQASIKGNAWEKFRKVLERQQNNFMTPKIVAAKSG